ncbi:MAG TPA: hypothetical protein VGW34_09565 [Allosphingosinicella sp.]|nr:hypothetical protein [Allosphingosinicella sp.]
MSVAPRLQRLALALFRSVTEDPEATWEGMTQEDRDDALGWARDALEALAETSP